MTSRLALACLSLILAASTTPAADAKPIRVLFLGDDGHHRPADRHQQLAPILALRGIDLVYTGDLAQLSSHNLAGYDGLLIYANITAITPEAETAMLDFVAGGKGIIPLHCASYCFHNSPRYIELVGAQFQRHNAGVFRTTIAAPDHPVMKGFRGFESWDETYVHTQHNPNRTVLEERVDGDGREPWTWVREHGKGRVFYTAWGHDDRTWGNAGFQNLVERGIRWAVGQDPGAVPAFADRPDMTPLSKDVAPFEYVDAIVPFYPAGERWGTIGEPIRKMQKPLPPAESLKHYVLPVGFKLELFVSEPQLTGKPICMNWDERGRLWVAETIDYPNELQPEPRGRDAIKICEDTDGDGKADKLTVFADKLSIPTSLTFARGGIIVHQAPHTLFLKDTNGDDVADERSVLFTGWDTGDTHAGPSNLVLGLDNWIYGMDGYSGFRGTVGGELVSFRQGFYRFKADGSKLEFLRNTNNNSWGVGLSEEGVLFGSTANNNPSVYMPIANRYYERVRGWTSNVLGTIAESPRFHPITDKIRQVDQHGSFTAAAGHALYTARAYPQEYWNRTAFVAGPTGHLLATFVIQGSNADFRSRNSWNLLASDDEWAAPIMAEVGPDGHVWVIDWYNYIVQHNPTPAGYRTGKGNAYETELRDKKHGRIYRVVYEGAKPEPQPELAGAAAPALVAALKHSNLFWRRHAQRLLVERGAQDAIPLLVDLVKDASVDAIGINAGAMHALWTLKGLGALDGTNVSALMAAVGALKHRSPGVRRNAALVLPASADTARVLAESGLINDTNGQVRLAALLALADMPASPEAAKAVVAALSEETNLSDRWLADGLTAAAAASPGEFLAAAAASPPRRLGEGSRARAVITVVAEHHARGGPESGVGTMMAALAQAPPAFAGLVITGLAKGWPLDRGTRLDATLEDALAALVTRLPIDARGQLVVLAGRWGSKKLEEQAGVIAASFLKTVQDDTQSDRARIDAATQLIDFRRSSVEVIDEALALITPRASPELAAGLLQAVGRSDAPEAGAKLVEALGALAPAARAVALRVLLSRAEWTEHFLAAVERGEAQLVELSLDQKQGLVAHPNRDLAARARSLLEKGGSLPNADRQKVFEELAPLAHKAGNAANGKEVYKKQCAKCHVHGAEGSRIGPDLTGMAVHPREELLLNIIDPSRSVEGNFRVYTVVTNGGQVITGLLASETRTSLELFDADAKKHAVLREDVAQLVASPKSLMPDGFEKQATREELVDLLEFLAQRGKYLPIPLDKVASASSGRGMFFNEESRGERVLFDDWSDKTFEGVPFKLIDPDGGSVRNVLYFYGPEGAVAPKMPRSIKLPVNGPMRALHLLSGISGWGFPFSEKGSVTLTVKLRYEDGQVEEQPLVNGVHFADYIRRVDVPESKYAFNLRGRQLRYISVQPKRTERVREVELVKGPDRTAPIVFAVTAESP